MTWARKFNEWQERKPERKAANLRALCQPVKSLHRGVYAGGTTGAAPKEEPYRDAALLEMARGRPCLVMVPGLCSHRVDTVVAAHSNSQVHGKGLGRKADDHFSAWSCVACHSWLDQGKAAGEVREAAFATAHARQVLAWRLIAVDPKEPERFRKAAQRALARLEMTEEA